MEEDISNIELESFFSDYDPVNFSFGSVEGTDWAAVNAMIGNIGLVDKMYIDSWTQPTTLCGQHLDSDISTRSVFSGSGTESEPMLLDERDALEPTNASQNSVTFPLPYVTTFSSSDLLTDLTLNLTSPKISTPPSMSKSRSASSSESSSFAYGWTPRTPGRCQGKSPKRPTTTGPSLTGKSQQKLEVLRNALLYNNLKPTTDQCSFLAKSVFVSEDTLEQWRGALLTDVTSILKGPNPGKPFQPGRVASWKQTIIRRGLRKVKAPSTNQIEFLAAGLRIKVEQFWEAVAGDKSSSGMLTGARGRGRPGTKTIPPTRLLKDRTSCTPLRDVKVLPAESVVDVPTTLDNSAIIPLLSKLSTASVDSSDSSPWDPLTGPETVPINPVDISNNKSQTCQHLQDIVDNITLVPDCKQGVEQHSATIDTRVTLTTYDNDMESNDEREPELSLEAEMACQLGPEYSHLTKSILSSFTTASLWDQWQVISGSKEHTSGNESTPGSSSSQTPGNASSPNTSASGSSGSKRKSSSGGGGGIGDGPDDLEPNGGDGNMDPPPPKKTKTPPIRYDCPIFRRSLRTGSTVRSCALSGLEFRNLWDHMRKAHYGCENCGLKLDGKRADKTHLREREKNASICNADKRNGVTFDIGIDRFAELEEIYDNRTLSPDDKWKKWWKLLFSDDGEPPDPRHHGTISISTASIPAFQESFHNMWKENHALPVLSHSQFETVSTILERLLRTAPIIQRHRHQNMQPRTPRTPAATVAMQAVSYATGQSPSYFTNVQEQDFDLGQNMASDIGDFFSSSSQGLSSNGNISFESSASTSFVQRFGDSGDIQFVPNE